MPFHNKVFRYLQQKSKISSLFWKPKKSDNHEGSLRHRRRTEKMRRTEKFASLRPLKSMFANNLQTISFISFFWLTSHTGNRHTDRDEELMKKGRALCFDLTACIITSLSVCLSLCLCICLSLSISLSHSKSLLHLEQGKGLVGCWWAAGWDVCLLKKQITADAPSSKKRNFY